MALYENGKTVDENLEQINFQKAGEALVYVWSKTVIVLHAVHIEFIKNEEIWVRGQDEEWLAKHVRQSQCILQIVKSSDWSCYSFGRSN